MQVKFATTLDNVAKENSMFVLPVGNGEIFLPKLKKELGSLIFEYRNTIAHSNSEYHAYFNGVNSGYLLVKCYENGAFNKRQFFNVLKNYIKENSMFHWFTLVIDYDIFLNDDTSYSFEVFEYDLEKEMLDLPLGQTILLCRNDVKQLLLA